MRAISPFRTIVGLLGWLALVFAAAAVGAQLRPGEWYAALRKPAWTPPNWIFAPVWTSLYLLMAVAAWRVWRRHSWRAPQCALGLFLAQLACNALWSWLFFGLHRPGAALVDIVVLWLTLLATCVAFWRADRLAGILLAPYLAWVSFAAALNAAVWWLNRGTP